MKRGTRIIAKADRHGLIPDGEGLEVIFACGPAVLVARADGRAWTIHKDDIEEIVDET